jgi:hypothetical protein
MSGNPNFLPESDGVAFVAELTALAESLAAEGSFKEKYLASELLTKYCDTSTTPPSERRSRAIDKWLGTETEWLDQFPSPTWRYGFRLGYLG